MTTIYTVGHSTLSADEFLRRLHAHRIRCLVDVRQYPGSRRHPQFSQAALSASLGAAGIAYVHEVDLGGRRRPRADSPNLYWRNPSFRAYADHMAGEAFARALDQVVALAIEHPTAIMCAESVPWKCHRWLIADALVARGLAVIHILDAEHSRPHALHANARLDAAGSVSYPAPLLAGDVW
jgi:uncharacterized protein (DUF488 family)